MLLYLILLASAPSQRVRKKQKNIQAFVYIKSSLNLLYMKKKYFLKAFLSFLQTLAMIKVYNLFLLSLHQKKTPFRGYKMYSKENYSVLPVALSSASSASFFRTCSTAIMVLGISSTVISKARRTSSSE